MRVVLRYRDGWWGAYIEGYTGAFASDRSFEALVCDLVDASYRIVAVERRKYASSYGDNYPVVLPDVRGDNYAGFDTGENGL